MNHKKISELMEVWPGLAREEQKRYEAIFKFAKSLRYELQPSGELRINEDSAVVNCRRAIEISTPDSPKPKKNEDNVNVVLRKKGGNWIIETMQ